MEEKKFTQEEVNQIVASRVARFSEKYSDFEELREKARRFDEISQGGKTALDEMNEKVKEYETELESLSKKKDLSDMKEKIASEMGIPSRLLTGTTEEEIRDQAQTIRSIAFSYPQVRDGGEPQMIIKETPAQAFANTMKNIGF